MKHLYITLDESDPKYQLWIFKGKVILRMDAALAREAAKISTGLVGRQEAHENPHKIIEHDALLIRTGAPFALTDGQMREEALKDAQWHPGIRKAMPMDSEVRQQGAQSAAKVGIPWLRRWRTS
jgi:hypothetical protein